MLVKKHSNQLKRLLYPTAFCVILTQRFHLFSLATLLIMESVQFSHQFLIGRHFTLQTDHKPLLAIFKPNNGIPIMAAGRVQRWAVYLSGFDYTIEHVKSEHNLSDTLSRLPIAVNEPNLDVDEENAYLNFMMENFPVKDISHEDIKRESRTDLEISTVIKAVRENNLQILTKKLEFKSFANKYGELAVEREILLWGGRVVIPNQPNCATQFYKVYTLLTWALLNLSHYAEHIFGGQIWTEIWKILSKVVRNFACFCLILEKRN